MKATVEQEAWTKGYQVGYAEGREAQEKAERLVRKLGTGVRAARLVGDYDRRSVDAYMPSGYAVVQNRADGLLVVGVDRCGWTLDGYVIPRLASGLIFAEEVAP